MARDPEFWYPPGEAHLVRRGRPRVRVERLIRDYPPPTPQPTPCVLWQGPADRYGYGTMADTRRGHGKKKYAHRWVWESANGPIPKGLVIRHKCDNPPCIRLSHLDIGTVADNNWDASERDHLGPTRSLSPTEVIAIWERWCAGEPYPKIAIDYPTHCLATIKRVKDYIEECYQITDTPIESRAIRLTRSGAGASNADAPAAAPSAEGRADPTRTRTTRRG